MSRARGHTLLETLIATGIVAVIGVAVHAVSGTATSAIRENTTRQEGAVRGDAALERLTRLLRAASLASLTTQPPGFATPQPLDDDEVGDDVGFRRLESANVALLPALSGAYAADLAPDAADPVNGADDDGDGVIDGRRLVVTDPAGDAAEVARRVTAFSVRRDGRSLVLTLTRAVRVDGGRFALVTSTATVELRNG